jgi:hypothetical protein
MAFTDACTTFNPLIGSLDNLAEFFITEELRWCGRSTTGHDDCCPESVQNIPPLSVISDQLSVISYQLSVASGKWQVASGEVGKWGDHFVRVAGGSGEVEHLAEISLNP